MDMKCFENIGILLKAKNLPKMDLTSHTDAFCIIYMVDPIHGDTVLNKITHTSVVRESENPEWPDYIRLEYHFEVIQEIVIRVYDQDDKADPLMVDKHDYIGEVRFRLSAIMMNGGGQKEFPIQLANKERGTLFITSEVVASTKDVLAGNFYCRNLINAESWFTFKKSSPFFTFERLHEGNTWTKVFESPYVKRNLNPLWGNIHIPLAILCNGDLDRPLRCSIFARNKRGEPKLMGRVQTTVRSLLAKNGAPISVIDERKVQQKRYLNSGTLHTSDLRIIEKHSMADYLMGGCEVTLMVAVDFTASNGDPADPTSLHHIDRITGRLNPYQRAISAVGNVLEQYARNKLFTLFGFGAKFAVNGIEQGPAQNCFPLVGPDGTPTVCGVEGMLQAYESVFPHILLSGPTKFTEVIQQATFLAANRSREQSYLVLLIITDGEIYDMSSTIQAIVQAANEPVSIVIVGVGDEKFTAMETLDGDGQPLRCPNGQHAVRDIVQFIPFRDYLFRPYAELSKAVLEEIPTQFLEAMVLRGIKPNGGMASKATSVVGCDVNFDEAVLNTVLPAQSML